MFFSDRNEDTVYINHYSGLLEVEGTGDLRVEDTHVSPCFEEDWAAEYDTLSITEGFTTICAGYLEAFPAITCLILSRSVTSIDISPELIETYQQNDLLVRGEYNSFAEQFARLYKLPFLHADIPLADTADEHERDIITLRFHPDSAPDIHHNVFTAGSSAGSYGGGEIASELPEDFYVGCTIEQFAKHFSEQARGQIMANEMLRRFLEAANRREQK